MKLKELKDKTAGELEKLLAETREQARRVRFGIGAAQHPKVRDLRNAKKTIARILTLLGEARKKNA